MANARFSEEQLLEILKQLKITLHGRVRECKSLTTNLGQLIKLASMEKALKNPDVEIGWDTVHQLNSFQLMLNETNQFLKLIEESKLMNDRLAA